MKIVKLTDGRIQLRDDSGNVYQSFSGCDVNAELKCNNEVIQIVSEGQYINIIVDDVSAYQIEPAPEVAGPFTAEGLLSVLDTDFFLCAGISGVIDVNIVSPDPLPIEGSVEIIGTVPIEGSVEIIGTVPIEGSVNATIIAPDPVPVSGTVLIATEGNLFGVNRGATLLTTLNSTQLFPLIAFRLKAGFPNSIVKPVDFSIICTSGASFAWYLIENPTVAGTAFSFSDVVGSSIEADAARTSGTTLTGGTTRLTGVKNASNSPDSAVEYKLTQDLILAPGSVYVLAVQRTAGSTETFLGGANFLDKP